jgi:hypothetical protein
VCPYSAIKAYVLGERTQWPANVCSHDHSYEAHLEAIRTGPYGRCVWKCDNDVVDHQTVNLQFGDDVTATFTMTAFTPGGGRLLRVHGTEGELVANAQESLRSHEIVFAAEQSRREGRTVALAEP